MEKDSKCWTCCCVVAMASMVLKIKFNNYNILGPGELSIVTWYRMHGLGFDFQRGQEIFLSHPLLVPWSRKGRAIPLLPLWSVWPVQGCTFPFFFTFTAIQTSPGAHRAFCTVDTRAFSPGENGQGMALTSHPHLAPRWSYSATPLFFYGMLGLELCP